MGSRLLLRNVWWFNSKLFSTRIEQFSPILHFTISAAS